MHQMHDVTVIPYLSHHPKISENVFLASGARVIGQVELGIDVNIWFNVTLRGDVNYIKVGKRTNIQDNSVVHVATKNGPTLIGNSVTIGHQATIHACHIDDFSLIGMGAVVLDGAKVGKYSIVGAGSVIPPNKTYPDHSLILGSPAVVKRRITDDEVQFLEWSADHYVDLGKNYILHCN